MQQDRTRSKPKSFWARLGDNASRRLWPLDTHQLCAEARQRTNLGDFRDRQIEERLFMLITCIEREANLHPLGRFLVRMHLRDLLQTRLLLADFWQKSRAHETERIQRPIFITGMPRSGSTFLHELLMQDRNHRAPLVWEVMFPLPLSPSKPNDIDQRIKKAAARLWWFRRIAPRADSVHPMRATTPHECVAIHSHTLLSQEFATILRIPGYAAFLDNIDLRPAYEWQKRFLKHLQTRCPVRRWVLKAPDHVFSLDALFAVFPDAVVVQMHRNPIEVLKSSLQLTEVLRRMFARPERRDQIGAREAHLLAEGMHRITTFRDSHPELAERFIDVNYRELVRDPVATVQRLYWELDLSLTDRTTEQVRSLAFTRGRYAHRPINPTLQDLGLDARIEARRFESYCARFGIPQV
jgi:hypothetical protein